MHDEGDSPLSDEELALARKGEELIAAAVADVDAPQSLREAIERDRERARTRAPAPFWRRHRWGLAAAGSAAAGLAPTKAAPAPLGGSPPVLDARVGNLAFPDWQKKFGWRAVGRRDDTLSGRPVTTVFYRNPEGARLGYTVVSGDPLGGNPPGHRVTRKAKAYNVARARKRTLVTWTQQGHTCALVAPSV